MESWHIGERKAISCHLWFKQLTKFQKSAYVATCEREHVNSLQIYL